MLIVLTLAALFWAWGRGTRDVVAPDQDDPFVGIFAHLIGNWNSLARIVFDSFAGLGLKASGTGLSAAGFSAPGAVAQVGLDAGRPILDSISGLMGCQLLRELHPDRPAVRLGWWCCWLSSSLAVQLFITLIEFKLTRPWRAFVMVPFGLFSKTAFLAERVLGNVVSSGVKILVLAVIVGIGSTCSRSSPRDRAALSPPSGCAWRWCWPRWRCWGLGIFNRHRQRHRLRRPHSGAGAANGDQPGCWRPGVAAGAITAGGASAVAGAARGSMGARRRAAATTAAGRVRRDRVEECPARSVPPPRGLGQSLTTSFDARRSRRCRRGGAEAGEAPAPQDAPPGWARRMRRNRAASHGASAAIHRALRRSRRRIVCRSLRREPLMFNRFPYATAIRR